MAVSFGLRDRAPTLRRALGWRIWNLTAVEAVNVCLPEPAPPMRGFRFSGGDVFDSGLLEDCGKTSGNNIAVDLAIGDELGEALHRALGNLQNVSG